MTLSMNNISFLFKVEQRYFKNVISVMKIGLYAMLYLITWRTLESMIALLCIHHL